MFSKYRYLSIGLAMFSMFFGAGNVIFPLVIGQMAGEQIPYAILGLLLTAVGVPFMGLIAILLFEGNYQKFFARIGKIPGLILTAIIMLLIGPFGGMPRCIALSYSTLKIALPSLSFSLFGVIACIIIFLCTFRKNRIIDLLGIVLTPLLLVSLIVIVISGLLTPGAIPPSNFTAPQSFFYGLVEGYNTMDLLASFFFSTIIFHGLKQNLNPNAKEEDQGRKIFSLALKASAVGASLLSLIYVGFSLVAAFHVQELQIKSQDELLGALTLKILGPYAGLFASATIAIACLTTAIALATVFAEFLQKSLFQNRINYLQALGLTLIVTYGVSTLEFKGIVALLAPILQVAYPALIALTVANILYSLYQFQPVKLPVYIVLLGGLLTYLA